MGKKSYYTQDTNESESITESIVEKFKQSIADTDPIKKSEPSIESFIDDNKWRGGWYQDITFPDGRRTISTTVDFDKHPTRSLAKWDIVEPFLTNGKFLDIGCNAGGYLVKAAETGKYDDLYGLDSSEHFLKQARFVLDQFDVKAKLHCSPALEFDFSKLPHIDTTIMINTLYWVAYSDEKGYVPNPDKELHRFLETLAGTTKDLILVGMEGLDRIGGNLNKTKEFVAHHFNIIEADFARNFKDRTLNYIYAQS